MAILIPEPCPSKATVGEKKIYNLLKDILPSDYHAWYEPSIAGRYPDFTVAAPSFGLLMIEVKGWFPAQIVKASDQTIEIQHTVQSHKTVKAHRHPIRQVREVLFGFLDGLAAPDFAILRQEQGEFRGHPCFPCGHAVVLTNITRAHLESASLSALFPEQRVICRDELDQLAVSSPTVLLARLRSMLSGRVSFSPLTHDQMATLKGALYQEVIVKRRPATLASVTQGVPLPPKAVVLDVLDEEQEKTARSMGGGHQIVFGIAGSGKSSLLLAKARSIAHRDPATRILILCYNKLLAAHLALQFADDPAADRIEVRTFHSWIARKTGLRCGERESFENYERRMIAQLLQNVAHFDGAELYDAIVVDEGHDFQPDWFRCITPFLKGKDAGDLLIAVDGAQSLYGRRREFTWISVGVHAQGRSRRLSRNYRNTKQILEFAWQVSQTISEDMEEFETNVRVVPTKAGRQGDRPCYHACPTIAAEHDAISTAIGDLLARGLEEHQIAVLYPRREHSRIDQLHRHLSKSFRVNWVSNEASPMGGVRSLGESGIKLMTIHASKGLEFAGVIVTAVDQLPRALGEDELLDSNLLYVGLTRATDHLVVTWARSSSFTERILRSTKATTTTRTP